MLLDHTPDPFSRNQFQPGHMTCTALVLSPAKDAFLLIHHARLDRWLLPGGHVEAQDTRIWDAARREAMEETSVAIGAVEVARLVSIDVHGIPAKKAEPYHLHHDLVFAFLAADSALEATDEVHAALWHPLAELGANPYHLPPNILLSAQRAVLVL